MANEALIPGGAAKTPRPSRTSPPPPLWPRSLTARSTLRSSSISGHRGAVHAGNWGRSSKKPCAPPMVRSAWSSSTSTKIPRSRSRCASSRSRRSMPSRTGRPVDGFVGALPESQVKQFVQRLGRRPRPAPRRSRRRWRWPRRPRRTATMPAPATLFSQILQHEPGEPRGDRRARPRADRRAATWKQARADARPGAKKRTPATPRSQQHTAALELAELAPRTAMGGLGKLRARLAARTPTTTRPTSTSPPRCSAAASGKPRSTNCWNFISATANGTSRRRANSWSSFSRLWAASDPLHVGRVDGGCLR